MRDSRGSNAERNAATFLALFGLLALAGGLLWLVAMVVPALLGIVVVVFGVFGFVVFHYLVWGCWLSNLQPRDDDDLD